MADPYRKRLSQLARRGRATSPAARPVSSAPPPCVPEGRIVESGAGAHLLVEEPASRRIAAEGGPPFPPPGEAFVFEEGGRTIETRRPVFFDLETTGFRSTPLFLSGTLGTGEDGGLVRQRFARDYSEEGSVVESTLEEIAAADCLVSFNGKSYDLPFLRARAAIHGIPFRLDLPHLDLLHAARRRWKGRFPDFRLQTLERLFHREERRDDVPGGDIPDLYHEYVRSGFEPRLMNVFRHNARDLITLARLFFLLAGGEEDEGRGGKGVA
ncbi:MAG: ribonuclease H-like domain-containing protein [Candidatus Eisenbacteria bacterium]|nr:ribonuclease H-like domain-containing protein [Candidatus Eisenbacteria bacterium]